MLTKNFLLYYDPFQKISDYKKFIELINGKIISNKISVLIGFEPKLIHLGYDRPLLKVRNFLDLGFIVYVLIADSHIILKNKTDKITAEAMSKHFEDYISIILNDNNIKFVYTSQIQNTKEFYENFIKIIPFINLKRVNRLLFLRNTHKKTFSVYYCLVLQLVDVLILQPDIVLCGTDQWGIYNLSFEVFKQAKINLKPLICAVNLMHDIKNNPLNHSKISTRITIYDNENVLKRKIEKLYCPPRKIYQNPAWEYFKFSILPFFKEVEIETKNGYFKGSIHDIEQFENLYKLDIFTPQHLKECLFFFLK